MEPDYLKHAQDLIDRLRSNTPPGRKNGGQAPPAPNFTVINAPRDCVFVIQNVPKPDDPPQ